MGNISEIDGAVHEIVGKVVPFTTEIDGCALAESVLAPNPSPEFWRSHIEKLKVYRCRDPFE